jgi:hypothetical protein
LDRLVCVGGGHEFVVVATGNPHPNPLPVYRERGRTSNIQH